MGSAGVSKPGRISFSVKLGRYTPAFRAYYVHMSEGISVDLGSILPYLEDKVRSLLGRDIEHVRARRILERHLRLAAHDCAAVQVVGMDRPVPIFDIYQPTRLVSSRASSATIDFSQLIRGGESAVIFGGPGRGKTMLMRHLFASLSRSPRELPLLFTLRWPGTTSELVEFVEQLGVGRMPRKDPQRVVLLVDGLDEVPRDERVRVASALRRYSSLELGPFYVTCRSFYSPGDIVAPQYDIAPFTIDDCRAFVEAFACAYGSRFDAASLLSELHERNLDDFITHPLMLTLVCILKSGPMPALPRTTLGLMRRALDVLTFRWDEAKGIYRESRIELDGDERVRCMMRVAYEMNALVSPSYIVERTVREHLKLIQQPEVPVGRLLTEIAQWYGVLVPTSDAQWTFVHRTLHDYLAARHWVESGLFSTDSVAYWDTRAAYAACLMPDATSVLSAALKRSSDIGVLVECFVNNAPFDSLSIALDILAHFRTFTNTFMVERTPVEISISTDADIFRYAPTTLLTDLLTVSITGTHDAHDLVIGCTLAELTHRNATISAGTVTELCKRYSSLTRISVQRRGNRTLFDVAPDGIRLSPA